MPKINYSPLDKVISENFKRLREEKDITLQELAAAIGTKYQQVQKYEMGVNRIPSAALYQTSLLLNVPISAFFNAEGKAETVNQLDVVQAAHTIKKFLELNNVEAKKAVVECLSSLMQDLKEDVVVSEDA